MPGLPPLNLDLSAGPSNAQGAPVTVGGVTFGDFVFKGTKADAPSITKMALMGGVALLALRLVRK
ncbi:MAG: hypothetical protein CSA72_08370 [Rhodobacterales bacterium]|nr:MAG: hypothetical protein CSA72_08370 [Rhodobacterales bacterium]